MRTLANPIRSVQINPKRAASTLLDGDLNSGQDLIPPLVKFVGSSNPNLRDSTGKRPPS